MPAADSSGNITSAGRRAHRARGGDQLARLRSQLLEAREEVDAMKREQSDALCSTTVRVGARPPVLPAGHRDTLRCRPATVTAAILPRAASCWGPRQLAIARDMSLTFHLWRSGPGQHGTAPGLFAAPEGCSLPGSGAASGPRCACSLLASWLLSWHLAQHGFVAGRELVGCCEPRCCRAAVLC